jgi:hypothetical protein
MRRTIICLTAVLALLSIAGSTSANRRPPKGSCVFEGVVLGPDDKPVSHASITYQSSSGNDPHALRADARGHFRITGLVADNYDVRATSQGIFSEWEKNVTVRKGVPTNVTLHLIYAKQMPKKGLNVKSKNAKH